ncbi:MAG TPA: restriction endonuclease subunit S, partial [Candidatus Woesebacteria bacterium]|nr:restriction endonuclease subunit S [Candidatus Woesebacteria bacterium]
QKIFSQDLKFKDENGDDYPEWEEKRLKNVFQRESNRNSINQVRFVLTNSATQGIVSQFGYFDKDIANQGNLTNYYVVDIDDFIYNPRISKYAPAGPLKRNKLKKGIMSPLYTILKAKKGNLVFLEKYFDTTYWHKYMFKIANYGARHDRMNILQDDFMNMPIPFPNLDEQQKIADFLSSIDDLINLTNQRITLAEKWKKGMMQRMFV